MQATRVSEASAILDAYSWGELADIADELATRDVPSACSRAHAYGLCGPGGSLRDGGSKRLVLADGTECGVRIAGLCHDVRSDGCGRAGISWVFDNAVSLRRYGSPGMGSLGVHCRGWEGSTLRQYVNENLLGLLPADLRAVIRPVVKVTGLPGSAYDCGDICWQEACQGAREAFRTLRFATGEGYADISGLVSRTSERLWVPSRSEVFGWRGTWQADDGVWHDFDAVNNVQGPQYRLFADEGVGERAEPAGGDGHGFGILRRCAFGGSCSWWLRTPDEYSQLDATYVTESGCPGVWGDIEGRRGVVAGFCL